MPLAYEPGDVLTYRNFFGGLVTGWVAAKLDDVKNGRPGFDLADPATGEVFAWGYDSQIVQVTRVSRAAS